MLRGLIVIYFRFAKIMQIKYFALIPYQEQGRSPKGEAYRQRSGVRAISFDTFL
jgi:hypothetical protein